jgi:hypothetical protein
LYIGRAVCRQLVRRRIQVDDLGLLAEARPEAEPEVERQADREGDVRLLQALPAGAAEAQLVVGGEAAAAHAVQEHGDAERLGERPQLLLPARPVEAGAGHDRGALGRGEQGRRLLQPLAQPIHTCRPVVTT